MNKHGLREIKREATAHALADAAFELTMERGLDGFVVEDVVQRAGYSRRTFANYYSCKEEAVASAAESTKNVDEVRALFERLPDSTTPLEVMYQLTKLQFTGEYLRKMRQLVVLSKQYPTLEPYLLSVLRRSLASSQEVLNRLFPNRYPEGYTHMLAGALNGALVPLMDGSLNVLLPGDSPEEYPEATTFDDYLETIYGYLRNGF
ncbi:TetR/AcrR family transcriptional regulator [Tumebacillus flagellatus]|uniref:TetR family transcriptional regulator n=1 Tax=Tumebacillus flagellatus TaxID=1157490 RepID=A0A074LGQ7_9BACL|nr:TetR/AcrR family transcriptional regulator [Tumebacillus flagellatus]KEO81416.1 TetR family transcriptional regulator [Tumebacillus flagellatus]